MYRAIEPLFDNTVCEARVKDGKVLSYIIKPASGYKLHEVSLDHMEVDEDGVETGEMIRGYTEAYVTAGVNYDFEKNSREIYAVLK